MFGMAAFVAQVLEKVLEQIFHVGPLIIGTDPGVEAAFFRCHRGGARSEVGQPSRLSARASRPRRILGRDAPAAGGTPAPLPRGSWRASTVHWHVNRALSCP